MPIKSFLDLLHFLSKPFKSLNYSLTVESAARLQVPSPFFLVEAESFHDLGRTEVGHIHFIGEDEDGAIGHIGMSDNVKEGVFGKGNAFLV